MQRERAGWNDTFGVSDPFAAFRGFGLMPSLFGGRDPFDDPFFTRPFGESSLFDPPSSASGGASIINKGVIIEELGSDDDQDMEEVDEKGNQWKHSDLGKEPSIEHPDDEDGDDEETKVKNLNNVSDRAEREGAKPQTGRYGFHTRKVTYGGVDGAYYTSSSTRRTGSDGVVIEESREADATTGQAKHRISRGIHDKGHSVTRKLNSDGKVDTSQTLHNLHEDELSGFEEAWKGNYKAQLPDWSNQFGSNSTSRYQGTWNNANAAVPAIEQARQQTSEARAQSAAARTKKVIRINID